MNFFNFLRSFFSSDSSKLQPEPEPEPQPQPQPKAKPKASSIPPPNIKIPPDLLRPGRAPIRMIAENFFELIPVPPLRLVRDATVTSGTIEMYTGSGPFESYIAEMLFITAGWMEGLPSEPGAGALPLYDCAVERAHLVLRAVDRRLVPMGLDPVERQRFIDARRTAAFLAAVASAASRMARLEVWAVIPSEGLRRKPGDPVWDPAASMLLDFLMRQMPTGRRTLGRWRVPQNPEDLAAVSLALFRRLLTADAQRVLRAGEKVHPSIAGLTAGIVAILEGRSVCCPEAEAIAADLEKVLKKEPERWDERRRAAWAVQHPNEPVRPMACCTESDLARIVFLRAVREGRIRVTGRNTFADEQAGDVWSGSASRTGPLFGGARRDPEIEVPLARLWRAADGLWLEWPEGVATLSALLAESGVRLVENEGHVFGMLCLAGLVRDPEGRLRRGKLGGRHVRALGIRNDPAVLRAAEEGLAKVLDRGRRAGLPDSGELRREVLRRLEPFAEPLCEPEPQKAEPQKPEPPKAVPPLREPARPAEPPKPPKPAAPAAPAKPAPEKSRDPEHPRAAGPGKTAPDLPPNWFRATDARIYVPVKASFTSGHMAGMLARELRQAPDGAVRLTDQGVAILTRFFTSLILRELIDQSAPAGIFLPGDGSTDCPWYRTVSLEGAVEVVAVIPRAFVRTRREVLAAKQAAEARKAAVAAAAVAAAVPEKKKKEESTVIDKLAEAEDLEDEELDEDKEYEEDEELDEDEESEEDEELDEDKEYEEDEEFDEDEESEEDEELDEDEESEEDEELDEDEESEKDEEPDENGEYEEDKEFDEDGEAETDATTVKSDEPEQLSLFSEDAIKN